MTAPAQRSQPEGDIVRQALLAVWEDWQIAADASGQEGYEIKDVSTETVQLVVEAIIELRIRTPRP